MNSLFTDDPGYPEGFFYLPSLISEQEESYLCSIIADTELRNMIFQGYEAKRKVASYGYDWSFDKRTLSPGKEIPAAFHWLIIRVADHLFILPESIAELLVTEYPVGSVINWHRDAPPFNLIAGISLLSDCIFKLRPHEKTKQKRNAVISLPVKRRSLYVMQGPARTDWQHSIAPVTQLRYSITLRTLKQAEGTK